MPADIYILSCYKSYSLSVKMKCLSPGLKYQEPASPKQHQTPQAIMENEMETTMLQQGLGVRGIYWEYYHLDNGKDNGHYYIRPTNLIRSASYDPLSHSICNCAENLGTVPFEKSTTRMQAFLL